MRYAHILNAVLHEPWMITPQGHALIVTLLQSRLSAIGESEAADRSGFFKEKLPSMAVGNGAAVIPIYGVLGNKLSLVEKSCGATDYHDIDRDLREAQARDEVKRIIFDINSPGGQVAGLAGLAARIANSSKRTMAFVSGEGASAALYLATAAQEIFAERGSLLGSVGTVFPFVDQTEAFAKEGLKVQLITSSLSPLKGTAWPGTSLSPQQRDYLQGLVDQMDADFRGFVKQRRSTVHDEALRGNMYSAAEAKRMNVIDGVVDGIDDLLRR